MRIYANRPILLWKSSLFCRHIDRSFCVRLTKVMNILNYSNTEYIKKGIFIEKTSETAFDQ